MAQRPRIYYNPAQRAEIWDRWQRGESMSSIGRVFERESSSIYNILERTGGIRPAVRKRSSISLTLQEREEISRGIVSGLSIRSIASLLDRSPSTVSREIKRNGGIKAYRAVGADQSAWDRSKRPKVCKLASYPVLARTVESKLKRHWSPQQIAGWLRKNHPKKERLRVSHETIYRTLYVQTRGALKKELQLYLRTKRAVRRSKHASLKRQGVGRITNAISISERPVAAEDRAVPGHWEGDLIAGSSNSWVATLVERHTRYVMLARIKNRDAETVAQALIKHSQKLPIELYKSLTWDRGTEMARHKKFTLATDIQVYFCDPHSPWQRGSNENTNRLLRQYLPKGTDLSVYSQTELNKIARQLNERPRKTLDYDSPAERFHECVAMIG